MFTRTAWVGAERVRDIVNTYDPESYKLPYGLENDFFQIKWKVGEGITSFYNKKQRLKCANPVWKRSSRRFMNAPKYGRGLCGTQSDPEEISADFTQSSIRVTLRM